MKAELEGIILSQNTCENKVDKIVAVINKQRQEDITTIINYLDKSNSDYIRILNHCMNLKKKIS